MASRSERSDGFPSDYIIIIYLFEQSHGFEKRKIFVIVSMEQADWHSPPAP